MSRQSDYYREEEEAKRRWVWEQWFGQPVEVPADIRQRIEAATKKLTEMIEGMFQ